MNASGGSGAVRGRLAPWYSWQEWEAVVSALENGWGSQYEWALRRAKVWRCRGRLPAALEFLLAVREARDDAAAGASEYAERCTLAMCIVRLVNGVTGATQQRGTSVSGIAGVAGLPSLCVEVRHAATHNALPPATQLRAAAQLALQWVHESYIQQQRGIYRHKRAELEDGWLQLMRAARDEALCAANGQTAEAVVPRKRRRAAIASLVNIIVAGFERDAVRVALDVWQSGLGQDTDDDALHAGITMNKKERRKRRREREQVDDDAKLEALRASLRWVGQKMGQYFRTQVADALVAYFIVGTDGEQKEKGDVAKFASIVARACGTDTAVAAARALDLLTERGEDQSSERMEKLRSLVRAGDASEPANGVDESNADAKDDTRERECARIGVEARGRKGGWTLCTHWRSQPIGFVIGDSLGDLANDDKEEEEKANAVAAAAPSEQRSPLVLDDADAGVHATDATTRSYNAQWRPVSSTVEAEDLVIGIL